MYFESFLIFQFQTAFRTLVCVGWRISTIGLMNWGWIWIGGFRRCNAFTAKHATDVSCPPVAYQRNVLENLSASLRGMENWL